VLVGKSNVFSLVVFSVNPLYRLLIFINFSKRVEAALNIYKPEHRILKKDGIIIWVIRINPVDAEARRIKDGDIVKMIRDRSSA